MTNQLIVEYNPPHMAMQEWEMRQRQKGNTAGAEVARVLREQYGDVPLPVAPERALDIVRFSPEQHGALTERGRLIYAPTGQSIATLREKGRKFWSTWHEEYPDFENLPSRLTEIAIDPQELFLPNSNRKTLAEQEKMIAKYSEKLAKEVPGVQAILGEAPDYVELAFLHLDATDERLFGEKYDYRYTRTKTPTVGSNVALVGHFYAQRGLHVGNWVRDRRLGRVWASPLVVPSQK